MNLGVDDPVFVVTQLSRRLKLRNRLEEDVVEQLKAERPAWRAGPLAQVELQPVDKRDVPFTLVAAVDPAVVRGGRVRIQSDWGQVVQSAGPARDDNAELHLAERLVPAD